MKLFRRTTKRDPKSFDPRRPHPYIDGSAMGLAGIIRSSIFQVGNGAAGAVDAASTNRVMASMRCAVPGCGKAAADDIHAPADA